MTFNSPKEMLDLIVSGTDLYSPEDHVYVFLYNGRGSICEYTIYPEEAVKLQKDADAIGDYWGVFLGWGGSIYDEDNEYATPMMFCEDYYQSTWMLCSDVTEEILKEA